MIAWSCNNDTIIENEKKKMKYIRNLQETPLQ